MTGLPESPHASDAQVASNAPGASDVPSASDAQDISDAPVASFPDECKVHVSDVLVHYKCNMFRMPKCSRTVKCTR
jgi:hypothetical protein